MLKYCTETVIYLQKTQRGEVMIGEFVSKASVVKILKAAIEACGKNTIGKHDKKILTAVLEGVVKMPTFVIREDDDEYE